MGTTARESLTHNMSYCGNEPVKSAKTGTCVCDTGLTGHQVLWILCNICWFDSETTEAERTRLHVVLNLQCPEPIHVEVCPLPE